MRLSYPQDQLGVMVSTESVRIGVIGAGAIVRDQHMPRLSVIPGVDVVSVCNRRRESAEAFASDFGVRRVCSHWREVVDDPNVDLVWIGATPYMHAHVSIAALDAGKHVFCQARMARNLAEARAMVAAADRHPELVSAICPPPTGMAGDATMRRLLRRERAVGKIRQVRLLALDGFLPGFESDLHWRHDIEQSGLNALSVGIYAEVLHRWVGRAVNLQAHVDRHVRERRDRVTGEYVSVQVPDSVSVIGELVSGADFVYQWSGTAHLGPTDELWVFGDQGTLKYDGATDCIQHATLDDSALVDVPIPEHERGSWEVEADVIRAVREGGDTGLAPDFRRGEHYMEFLEATMRSARHGQRVYLPLP